MPTKISRDVYEKLVGKSIDIKTNKYHNRKVFYDGHWFDSEKEKSFYIKFKLMEKAGEIKNLRRQISYELQPSYKIGNKTVRSIKYIADFVFEQDGIIHIIDVKGYRNEVYRLKKKIFEFKYGIEIEEL